MYMDAKLVREKETLPNLDRVLFLTAGGTPWYLAGITSSTLVEWNSVGAVVSTRRGESWQEKTKEGSSVPSCFPVRQQKTCTLFSIQQHAPLELEHRPLPCFSSSLQTLQTRPMRKGNYQNPTEEICVQCSEQWLWSCLRTTLLPRSAHTCVQHRLNKMHQSASQNRKGNSGVEHGSDQHHRCASSQCRQHLRTAASAPRH